VTAGVEGMREYLESPRLRERVGMGDCDLLVDEDCDRSGDRYRSAVFAQDEWLILSEPSLIAVPALRVDVDSQFGTHVSPKLAVRWDPNQQVVMRASYGRGFRAPDFKQLYLCYENPNAGYFVMGNPELEPENSHNMNLGVEVRHSERVWFAVNFYYNVLDNLIAFDLAGPAGMEEMSCGVGVLAPFTYRNIESAFTRGVETLVRTRPSLGPLTGVSIEVGYVLNDSRDQDAGGGVTITRVKATHEEMWVFFDFDTMEAVEPATPETSDLWDLGFRRFHIKLNGGVSGTGGMEVALLAGVAFADVTQAPADGYVSDAPDDEDVDLDPEYVMSNGDTAWFDYSPMTHVLTPRDHVYVVRSVEGRYYKMQLLGYYDDAGSPAYPRFQWSQIPGPDGSL
jgi:hypothetical protein